MDVHNFSNGLARVVFGRLIEVQTKCRQVQTGVDNRATTKKLNITQRPTVITDLPWVLSERSGCISFLWRTCGGGVRAIVRGADKVQTKCRQVQTPIWVLWKFTIRKILNGPQSVTWYRIDSFPVKTGHCTLRCDDFQNMMSAHVCTCLHFVCTLSAHCLHLQISKMARVFLTKMHLTFTVVVYYSGATVVRCSVTDLQSVRLKTHVWDVCRLHTSQCTKIRVKMYN